MEDIGLVKQGWKWLLCQRNAISRVRTAMGYFKDWIEVTVDRHWPVVCSWSYQIWLWEIFILKYWKDSITRGLKSIYSLGSAALLLIMWSYFLSLTSLTCLLWLLLSMGAAGGVIQYLGFTPGFFIVGLFTILILWMYGNFWLTGIIFIVGGYLFSLHHARLVVFVAAVYAIYSVKIRVGWIGVLLSINLSFFSNDILNILLKCCDDANANANVNANFSTDEKKECEAILPEGQSNEPDCTITIEDTKKTESCKAPSRVYVSPLKECLDRKGTIEETSSSIEMKRIINSEDYYEALGFPRHKRIDAVVLKKEYRKKAVLVHPDKNMGSQMASESFKKLQCAYEVLSDVVKKKDYDEQLRKDDLRAKSVCQNSHSTSRQASQDYCAEESRRIQCTRCGNSHIWVCTNRPRMKARWCQDCCQYHQAKDGDGWVEHRSPQPCSWPQKFDIPRAFVCAESKIFDVSEWATCQGMTCRSNTHRPSFHVNMVGLEKSPRANSARYPWDLDAEMMDEDDEEFELWLQEALASGLFCETSMRRKSWSPFKLHLKKSKKQWRRTST